MTDRKMRLKPTRKGKADPKEFARKAREFHDRLTAEGRWFGDSTEIVRRDRDTRV